MKKLLQFHQNFRILLGIIVLLFGLALSWKFFGLDGMGLLLILPFAAFFIWVCPELWRGE